MVFDYAILIGKTSANPILTIPNLKKEVKHQLSLPKELIPEFFSRLETYPSLKTQLAIKLLMLTFVRVGELRFIVNLNNIPNQEPTMVQCLGFVAICVICAKIIMQISSLSSSWFSSNNQAGGMSASVASAMTTGAGDGASVGMTSGKMTAKGAGKVGKGIGKLVRRLILRGG